MFAVLLPWYIYLHAHVGIEGSDDEALDTGQDEEVSRWEQEQIRKGISIPQVNCSLDSFPKMF